MVLNQTLERKFVTKSEHPSFPVRNGLQYEICVKGKVGFFLPICVSLTKHLSKNGVELDENQWEEPTDDKEAGLHFGFRDKGQVEDNEKVESLAQHPHVSRHREVVDNDVKDFATDNLRFL